MPGKGTCGSEYSRSGLVFVLLVLVLFLCFVFVLLVGVVIVVFVTAVPDRILVLVQSLLLSAPNLCCPVLSQVSINGSLAIPVRVLRVDGSRSMSASQAVALPTTSLGHQPRLAKDKGHAQ